MAQNFSFDIVSKVDLNEVQNAVNQASKEISQRYDFKGSVSEITLNQEENEIGIHSDDEPKLRSVVEILKERLVKRGVSLKALTMGTVEPAAAGTVRQKIDIQSGIESEKCKEIVKFIKDTKIKVQAAIQQGQIRVSGPKKDDLQTIMTKLRGNDFKIHMEFTNYR